MADTTGMDLETAQSCVSTNTTAWAWRNLSLYGGNEGDSKMCIRDSCFRILADYLHLLMAWRTDYAPHSPEEAFHPRFVEALQKQDQVAVSYTHLAAFFMAGETPGEMEDICSFSLPRSPLCRRWLLLWALAWACGAL